MATLSEIEKKEKRKEHIMTKLEYLSSKYLLSKEDKTSLPEMKKRWGLRDRDIEDVGHFPIYKFEDIKDKKKNTIVETKIVDKRMSTASLFEIIKHDPTSVLKEDAKHLSGVMKVGGYTQWLINVYFKILPDDFKGSSDTNWSECKEKLRRFFEDLYRVKEDLQKFNRFKKRLPKDKHDIGQVKDTDELYDLTKTFSLEEATMTKSEVKRKILADNAKRVFEDKRYEIIIPLTGQASHELAGPPLTRWCTASSQYPTMHDSYSKNGPLYIIRDKNDIVSSGKGVGDPRPIYQFHFESSQYMDVEDRRMDVVKYLSEKGNEGLKEFFRPNFLNAFNKRDFDPNDSTFKNYVVLYGANEETEKLILQFLEKKVTATDEIVVMDDNKDYSGYVEMLGHEPFFKHLLDYAKTSTRIFEVTFKKYAGKGIDVPSTLGKLVNVTNMVMGGFVKSLPKEIGNMKKLELLALSKNPNFKGIPQELSNLTALQVLNIMECNVKHSDLPKALLKAEDTTNLLIITN